MRTLGAAPGRPGTPSLAAASLTTTHCSGSRVTAATGARLPRGASTGAQGSITGSQSLVAFTEQHDVVIIVVVVGKCTFVLGNRALHRRSANGFGEFGVPHSSTVTHNRHHEPVFST